MATPTFPADLPAPNVGVVGMWADDPDEGERATRALRELATPLIDMSTRMDYLDFQRALDPFFPAGANHARLARVKAAYDPENRFRLNQNIRPAGDAS